MMSDELLGSNRERGESREENNPWGEEYREDVPPFSLEHEGEGTRVDDRQLVEAILDIDDEEQRELLDMAECAKAWEQGEGRDVGRIKERFGDDDSLWMERIEAELDEREAQQRILVDALSCQQEDSKYRDKTIEEILRIKSEDLTSRMTEATDEERGALIEERSRIDSVADRVKDFRDLSSHERLEDEPVVDMASAMDKLEEKAKRLAKNIDVARGKKEDALRLEQSNYGYNENEGQRPPIHILSYEEDISRSETKLAENERDQDLLYRIYRAGGKEHKLSMGKVQAIIDEMVKQRDEAISEIDARIKNAEVRSEEWKKLKEERRRIYRMTSDESIRRVLGLLSEDN